MVFGERKIRKKLKVNGEELQNVEELIYLSSTIIHNLDSKKEVTLLFAKAKSALVALDLIWKSKKILLGSKVEILKAYV